MIVSFLQKSEKGQKIWEKIPLSDWLWTWKTAPI